MALQAVGFDIDGTLYPDYRAWRQSVGFFLGNSRSVRAFTRTRKTMRVQAGQPGADGDPLDTEARLFAVELGLSIDDARRIRDEVMYTEWERVFRKVKIYPGVREALLRLKDAGLKLAALSDFPVGRKLEYFGLADLFDSVLGFPESGGLKPAARPFLRMAEDLSLEPDQILYVGNKLDYDVHGAEAAGMRGALIGPPGRRAPAGTLWYRDYRQMAERILAEVNQ